MSQDFNKPGNEQPNANPQNQKKTDYTKVYIGVIALLLATNIYLFISRNKIAGERDTTTVMYNSADSSRTAVEADYNAALVRLDELVSKNTQMDSIINSQNGDIAKMRREIDGIVKNKNATAADLGRARRLINELNGKVQTYEERIATLEKENTDLTNTNTVVTKERDSAVTENVGLQQKVKLGAVLHASNIRMEPIDLRRGGKKERETSKAKKVDVLRIKFDIDENRIAENGNKEIFVRVTSPSGSILSNAAYGSGVTTNADGQSLNYTLLKQIALQQNQSVRDVTVDWNQDSDYQKGTYTIDLFNEGYKIGGGTVNLR